MSKLPIVLKALRHIRGSIRKMGTRCVQKGFLTMTEIKKHDETRKAAGLPSKAEEAEQKRQAAKKKKKKKKKKKSALEKLLPWNW